MRMPEGQRLPAPIPPCTLTRAPRARYGLRAFIGLGLLFTVACGNSDEPSDRSQKAPPNALAQDEFDATHRGGMSRQNAEDFLPWVRALKIPSGWSVRVSTRQPASESLTLQALVLLGASSEPLAKASASDLESGVLECELSHETSDILTAKATWSDGRTWSRPLRLPQQ